MIERFSSMPVRVAVGFFSLFLAPASSHAGVVDSCKSSGTAVLELKSRDRGFNIEQIKKADLKSEFGAFVRNAAVQFKDKADEDLLQARADEGNLKFASASLLKDLSIKFSTKKKKTADPKGYITAIKDLMAQYNVSKDLDWFLDVRDPLISHTALRPTGKDELGDSYGAILRVRPDGKGAYKIEVVVSNDASESLPYLMTLVSHELVHARSFYPRLKMKTEQEHTEFLFVDEARAYDRQISTYLSLVKQDPKTFCNWLVASWSMGDIVVPLSWVIASMEARLKSGEFMIEYAKEGVYRDKPYLLTADKKDLSPQIKAKIKALKLPFVGVK